MNNPTPGFITRSSVSESVGGGPLTKEHFERAIEDLMRPSEVEPVSFLGILQSMANPATVEDYKWWVGESPTWRAIEPWDLPGYVEPAPLPSYLELFQ